MISDPTPRGWVWSSVESMLWNIPLPEATAAWVGLVFPHNKEVDLSQIQQHKISQRHYLWDRNFDIHLQKRWLWWTEPWKALPASLGRRRVPLASSPCCDLQENRTSVPLRGLPGHQHAAGHAKMMKGWSRANASGLGVILGEKYKKFYFVWNKFIFLFMGVLWGTVSSPAPDTNSWNVP